MSMTLPLSKYYNPEQDLPELADELVYVDAHFTKDAPQSEHRRWEYAMALRALHVWQATRTDELRYAYCLDVGGAGSPFHLMLGQVTHSPVRTLDPNGADYRMSLETYVQSWDMTTRDKGPQLWAAVFCLSVLEHVEDLDQFLYHLSCLVAPGGLLFLTVDCCGCLNHEPEDDPHHFNGMRKRIFTPEAHLDLYQTLYHHQLRLLGEEVINFDYAPRLYGGATDPGYSFASLALVKRA